MENLDFENKTAIDIPLEDMSPASRIRFNLWLKKSLHRDLLEIAEAEDATVVTVVRRALIKFVREYKEAGKF